MTTEDKRVIIGDGDGVIARAFYHSPTKDNPGGVLLAGGGGLTPVLTQDAASKTTVDFTSGIEAGFDYELEWGGLKTTDNDEGVQFRVGDGGGFKTTNYMHAYRILRADGITADQFAAAGGAVRMTYEGSAGNGLGNAADESMRGVIKFSGDDFVSTALHCLFTFEATYLNTVGNLISVFGGGAAWVGGVGALTSIQLLTENGNGFTSGNVTLRKKARS